MSSGYCLGDLGGEVIWVIWVRDECKVGGYDGFSTLKRCLD